MDADICKKYPHTIWLNPSFHSQADSMYWMESEGKIRELVDMYPLTVDGLKHGIKKLMSDKKIKILIDTRLEF